MDAKHMAKKYLLLLIVFLFTLVFSVRFVYAQTVIQSNPVITKVGNPLGPPPIASSIIDAASQIIPLLQKGTDDMYNVKTDEPGVYYWCTYLIVDSYNKAGFTGMTRSADGAVLTMASFFQHTPGYTFLAPNTPVESLQPGMVVFFQGTGAGAEHVSLIKEIDVDPTTGNGTIRTYDANNVVTEDTIFVVNHYATQAQTTQGKYAIIGFGTVS